MNKAINTTQHIIYRAYLITGESRRSVRTHIVTDDIERWRRILARSYGADRVLLSYITPMSDANKSIIS